MRNELIKELQILNNWPLANVNRNLLTSSHRCQLSRSGRDGTDIKALTRRPTRRPLNPLIVPLLHAHRDTPTDCIVTPTMLRTIWVGLRGEEWRTESGGCSRQSILRVFICNMCLQSLVSLILISLLLIKVTRVAFSRRGHKSFTYFSIRL
jgi:hypothetical protein